MAEAEKYLNGVANTADEARRIIKEVRKAHLDQLEAGPARQQAEYAYIQCFDAVGEAEAIHKARGDLANKALSRGS